MQGQSVEMFKIHKSQLSSIFNLTEFNVFYLQNRNSVRFANLFATKKFRGTRSKILQKIGCPSYRDVSTDILSQLNLSGILPNESLLDFHRALLLSYSYIAESLLNSHPSLFFLDSYLVMLLYLGCLSCHCILPS
jgi:hypothetical protein